MNIKPFINLYSTKIISANNNHTLPLKKERNVPFKANLSTSDLLDSGYRPVSIKDDKIFNTDEKILIDSPQKFLAVLNSPDIWNKKIVLSKDINLKGEQIKPIGSNLKPFRGEFDGNGCVISNFKIDLPNSQNVGLFGKADNAKIKNLKIKNAYINGKQQVGGLVGGAFNCEITECLFDGYIEGFKKVGGLIGLSKNNKIEKIISNGIIKTESKVNNNNLFGSNNDSFIASGIAGGLIGTDEDSELQNSYSYATLVSDEQTGGLVGYAENTDIKNTCFNGNIDCDSKAGALIGWGVNVNLANSYALSNKNNIVGCNVNTILSNTTTDLDKIKSTFKSNINSDIWTHEQKTLPRLKIQQNNTTAEQLFLEDVKYSKEYVSEKADIKLDIFPPKHYEDNKEMLSFIKNCQNAEELHNTFGRTVLNQYNLKSYGQDDSKLDELLLAFVKNPHMNFNKKFEYGYNVCCTPLFILTCLNKAYILQEALKRKDVDPTIKSGLCSDLSIWHQAFKHHIDNCAFVMLQEPKMNSLIENDLNLLKSYNLSSFARVLLEKYPDNLFFDKDTGSVQFSEEYDNADLLEALSKLTKLEDVQRLVDFDSNYIDSNGNNIVNVASTLEKEEDALKILIAAKRIGTNLDNWNKNGETPLGHALYTNKCHFAAQLLDTTNTPFMRLSDGNDAMLLFSKMDNENCSLNYMDIARKRGLSVNSQDKNGVTPLINAISNRHYKEIKYLLSHGANPNLYDNSHQTPLHYACINNDKEAIKLLLESYAFPNIEDDLGNRPFDYADEDTKKDLQSIFEDKEYLFELSGFKNQYECHHNPCNLDNYNKIGFEHEFLNFSDALLSDIDTDKNTLHLLKNAVLTRYFENFYDNDGNNILHLAAASKSFYAKEAVKAVIDTGVSINELNNNNETPLMKALDEYLCTEDKEEKINLMQNIKLLLDYNPNVDLIDNNKQSALHRVCQSGNLLLFNEILKHNPKLNQVDALGKTPFEYIPNHIDAPMYLTAEKYLQNYKILRREND